MIVSRDFGNPDDYIGTIYLPISQLFDPEPSGSTICVI